MFNDTVTEYLIKTMSCAAVLLKSREMWRVLCISMAVFFWRAELRFVFSKLKAWLRGFR